MKDTKALRQSFYLITVQNWSNNDKLTIEHNMMIFKKGENKLNSNDKTYLFDKIK